MNELFKRFIFALLAAPLFIWLLVTGSWPFYILVLILTLGIQLEVIHIAKKANLKPNTIFSITTGIWLVATSIYPDIWWIGLVLLVYLVIYETLSVNPQNVQRLFSTFFCALYAPVSLMCFILIRDIEPNAIGMALVLVMIFSIWGADVFAYFGGKFLGKHLLAERLSPKKTWEGFLSGLLIGTPFGVGLVLVGYHLAGAQFPLSWPLVVGIMAISGILGPIGDLAESKLKRSAGVKDSGTILPGHGGLFDRFDSLLLTSPAVLALLEILELLS